MYESNYIPGMNQCKNLRMQLCSHWITHPSWQELIALKWIVYHPLAWGIKINARRVNSVSSLEALLFNQPLVPSPQLYKIRSKEKKEGAGWYKNMYWFSFQHLLFQLGVGLSDSSGATLLSACIQLTQRSRHLNTNLKSSGLFLQHCPLK